MGDKEEELLSLFFSTDRPDNRECPTTMEANNIEEQYAKNRNNRKKDNLRVGGWQEYLE